MRQFPGRVAHALKPPRILQQRRNGLSQPDSFQGRFLHHDGGSVLRQRLGVHPLMIIRSAGERNENCRLPAAAISATVLAPDRQTTRSARAKAAGMSSMNLKTSAASPSGLYAVSASL